MNSERDSDDLAVLARRGDLSDADQRRLRDVLKGSVETRLLFEAGSAFDKEAPVVAGDDERIERMVRQVQRRVHGGPIVPLRRQAVRALAAGMLLAGVAIGAVQVSGGWLAAPKPSRALPSPGAAPLTAAPRGGEKALPAEAPPSSAAPASAPAAAPEPAPSSAAFGDVRAPLRSGARGASAPTTSRESAPPPPELPSVASFESPAPAPVAATTAAELFAAANRARVSGDVPGAIALSKRLLAEFPQSHEAVTAHLSLGVLYLQRGQAGLALEQFRIYRRVGSGATMAEALWGEAQSLRQLGRSDEERMVLEELLQKYPRSAFSDAAQKRLAALR